MLIPTNHRLAVKLIVPICTKKAPSARKKTSIESDCLATQAQWLYVGRMQAKNHQTKIVKDAFTKNKSLNKTNFIYQYLYQITVQEQILYLANCY